ncbi:hypothetical protein [Fusobacterium gastrosuis]|uniref:hypothetical protein n=1 Tax=Fusobacterium gastrosuis TaxID=1755100 RepID=UPI002979C3FC|nr:hypothetical protein [Fusobacteriaceae bacterium]MDY5713852.1 hypothetical protein [Fusobacterium gastrosuis]
MSLWTKNEENLKVETAGANYLTKSGIYECSIEEAQIIKGQNGVSTALQVIFKTENDELFRVKHWYIGKEGKEVKAAAAICQQLFYLLKLKEENVKILEVPDKKVIIPDLVGKTVGVINTVEYDGQYYNHNVKAYFDIKSKKTSKEILEKKNAEVYERWKEIFNKEENKNTEEKVEDKNEGLPEEFPF